MKKALSLVLALALLLCGITAVAETATEVLTLYLASVSMDNGENWMDVASLGMTVNFTLYDNGTVLGVSAMGSEEESVEGTWVEDGDAVVVTIDGDAMTIVANEAGELLAEMDGLIYSFSLTAPEAVVLPATVAADDAAAFNGTWDMGYLTAKGMTLNMAALMSEPATAEMLGISVDNAQLVITDGSVTLFGEDLGQFTMKDGALVLELEGFESLNQKVALAEDGSLIYTMLEGMDLYFTKAE